MNFRTSLSVLAAVAAFASPAAVPEGWTDDFDAAASAAAENGKLLLVDFSGSDWCGWCKKLDREVFAKKEFVDKAKEKFELVLVDSPNDKSLLSEKAAKRNPELVKKYGISGFPSVYLMDAKGKVLYKTGYRDGGPEAYLKHLDGALAMVAAKEKLSKELANLEKGCADRLKKIDEVVSKLSADAQEDCRDFIKELLANDPNGEYAAKYPYFSIVEPLEGKLRKVFSKMNSDFRKKAKALGHKPSAEEVKKIRAEVEAASAERLAELKKELEEKLSKVPESVKDEVNKMAELVNSILSGK